MQSAQVAAPAVSIDRLVRAATIDTRFAPLGNANSTVTGNLAVTGGGIWVRPGYSDLALVSTEICGNVPDAISGQYEDIGKNILCTGCRGDVNNNGQVDGADVSIMLGYWGFSPIGVPVSADLDNSGVVDAADLAILLANWGVCP